MTIHMFVLYKNIIVTALYTRSESGTIRLYIFTKTIYIFLREREYNMTMNRMISFSGSISHVGLGLSSFVFSYSITNNKTAQHMCIIWWKYLSGISDNLSRYIYISHLLLQSSVLYICMCVLWENIYK